MKEDHFYNGTPVHEMPHHKIYEILADGACYSDGDPTVPVTPEDWFWIKMRLEVELIRRKYGIPFRT